MKNRLVLIILFLLIFWVTDIYPYPSYVPAHHIQLEFDLKAHTLKGIDRLRTYVDQDRKVAATIHKEMEITAVKGPDDTDIPYSIKEEGGDKKRLVISLPSSAQGEVLLHIEYHATFKDFPGDIKFSREFLSEKPVAYVGEEIILLDGSAFWYPAIEGYGTFTVITTTPPGYEVVMEGARLVRKVEEDKTVTIWNFSHPSTGVYLVSGKYTITEDKFNNIPVYAYFFPEDASLATSYIEHSKKYLELYERLLGKYPFEKFAVVENILPTGFGMPSYTLLGQAVLRLPFIVKTSLGHEIAHNWWGNSVYPDYESGNWSEGITTYVADHLYDEMDGKGAQYRAQILRDYTGYVEPSKEYPLTRFKNRIGGPADRSIGYGKGAFVFHMLRVMLGDDLFYKGLREVIAKGSFQLTSWSDFRSAFEKVSGKDLGWFFRQWVEGAGAPLISLGDVKVQEDNKRYRVRAEIHQKEKAYEIYLPVLVETEEGPLQTYHWIKGLNNTVEIESPAKPRSIIIDPTYDVFRRLNPEEIPATIGQFMGAKDKLIVLPSKGDQEIMGSYFKVASDLDSKTTKTDRDVTEEDLKKGPLYVMGGAGENLLTERLIPWLPADIKMEDETIIINGKSYPRKDAVLLVAITNPYNPETPLLLLVGDNPQYIASAGQKLLHYGKYSYLLFVKGENAEKGTWDAAKMEKTF